MPGFNRTGPLGQGPMTGRRMGRCTNFGANLKENKESDTERPAEIPEEEMPPFYHGYGWGRGPGFGRGRGMRAGRGWGWGPVRMAPGCDPGQGPGRGWGWGRQYRFRGGF